MHNTIHINYFMAFYRASFPEATLLPKMQILKGHVIPWFQRWHMGFGIMREQGMESKHAHITLTLSPSLSLFLLSPSLSLHSTFPKMWKIILLPITATKKYHNSGVILDMFNNNILMILTNYGRGY